MTPSEEHRWWTALTDLAEQRIRAVLAAHEAKKPIYDPTRGAAGDGWPCQKCRRVMRSDVRLCPSCGYINR